MVAERGSEPGLSHPYPLDASMEALTLNLTEVVKRQNPKSKKGFNQVWLSSPCSHILRRLSGHVCVPVCVCAHVHMCVYEIEEGCPRAVGGYVGERRGRVRVWFRDAHMH